MTNTLYRTQVLVWEVNAAQKSCDFRASEVINYVIENNKIIILIIRYYFSKGIIIAHFSRVEVGEFFQKQMIITFIKFYLTKKMFF